MGNLRGSSMQLIIRGLDEELSFMLGSFLILILLTPII